MTGGSLWGAVGDRGRGGPGLSGPPGHKLQVFVGSLAFHGLNSKVSCIADRAQRKLCECVCECACTCIHVSVSFLFDVCIPLTPVHMTWERYTRVGRRGLPACDLSLRPRAQALWTKDGAAVVYPCHAVIVVLCVDTREQRFFLGHTDKVGTAGPGVACTQRLHSFPQPAASPGLCPGIGWEQLSAGLSPGTPPQHAAPLGLPHQELPVPVPEPCPHRLLPQVGEGPLRRAGAALVTLTVSSTPTASPTAGHYSAALARTATGRW